MHPAQIQADLKRAGYSQRMIAQELEVSPTHVSCVINMNNKTLARPSDRVMKRIAEIIKRRPEEVFPKYYFRKNRRLRD